MEMVRYITFFASWLSVLTCLCAGGYSIASPSVQKVFDVSAEMGTLGLSMRIQGFVLGPMLLAPLSEYHGRGPVYIESWCVLVRPSLQAALLSADIGQVRFQILLALAPNIGTVIVRQLI